MTILNPVESKITSLDALTDYDFDPIANTNASNPSIDYDPYYENVGTLDITIEKTSDNSIPSSVQLAIFGCSDDNIISTKAQIEQTTPLTTTGNILYLREDKSCLPLCLDNAGPLTKQRTTITTTGNLFYLSAFSSSISVCLDAAGPLTKQRTTITTSRIPTTLCANITNLAQNGSTLFSKVKINNKVVANDALANPFALTKLPTTISITFKSVSSRLDS